MTLATAAEWARFYTEKMKWGLVSIPAGSKAPITVNWQNKPIVDPDHAERHYLRNATLNIGVIHNVSQTCAFDVDHMEYTRLIFDELGIDLDRLLRSAPRIIGQANRGKLLYRVPDFELTTHKLSWPNPRFDRSQKISRDNPEFIAVFELRAGAGVQDVLPPSIHPDTGLPYRWDGPLIDDGLPALPLQLLSLWKEWPRFVPQLQAMCPWASAATKQQQQRPAKPRRASDGANVSVIDAYNTSHSIESVLLQYGYKKTRKGRFLSPNSSTGLAGVVVFDNGKAFTHHASDPFDNAHSFDAFDVFCQYKHGGNVGAAVREAAAAENITSEPKYSYAASAEHVEHGARVYQGWKKNSLVKVRVVGSIEQVPKHLLTIPGMLDKIVEYYRATAPRDQPQYAVQTALAIGSTVMGRKWVTNRRNYSSMYFIMIGKSSSGKEHVRKTVEDMLGAAELDLVGPTSYTSESGLFSTLEDQPCHVTVIDELGLMLKSMKQSRDSHLTSGMLKKMMEVYGLADGKLRTHGYSTAGLNKQSADSLRNKVVTHPALTVVAMTTTNSFYDNLTSDAITNGFLARFVIVESNIGRGEENDYEYSVTIADEIVAWLKYCANGAGGNLMTVANPEHAPPAVVVPFSEECKEVLKQFKRKLDLKMDEAEVFRMEEMYGRVRENAMRLALIVSVSKNEVQEISIDSLRWAIDYVEYYAERLIAELRSSISDSGFEATYNAALKFIVKCAARGATTAELARSVRLYRQLEPSKRNGVMEALKADHGIKLIETVTRTRTRKAWVAPVAIIDEDETLH